MTFYAQLDALPSGGFDLADAGLIHIAGPMWLPPTPQELLAKCPFDGHSPYNDGAKAMLAGGTLPDTRHDRDAEPQL